jgi:hypothetical protein
MGTEYELTKGKTLRSHVAVFSLTTLQRLGTLKTKGSLCNMMAWDVDLKLQARTIK